MSGEEISNPDFNISTQASKEAPPNEKPTSSNESNRSALILSDLLSYAQDHGIKTMDILRSILTRKEDSPEKTNLAMGEQMADLRREGVPDNKIVDALKQGLQEKKDENP